MDINTENFSIIAGYTKTGDYIIADFFDLCVGNRNCLFASEIEEVDQTTQKPLRECCHWLPQIDKERNFKSSGSFLVHSKVNTNYKNDSEIEWDNNETDFFNTQQKGISFVTQFSENTKIYRYPEFTYINPILRIPRTPLYWTLLWVRGVGKKAATMSKQKCICKCRESADKFQCINPWHYIV